MQASLPVVISSSSSSSSIIIKEKSNLHQIKIENDKSSNNNNNIYYSSAVDIYYKPHLHSTFGLTLMDGNMNIKEEEYMSSRYVL